MRTTTFVTLFFISSRVIGQNTEIEKYDDYLKAHIDIYHFSGVVLIANHDKVIFSKTIGMANYELSVPNSIETKFRIASVTKQFVAASILQLEEKGRLKIEDRLNKYFPEIPKSDSITIGMLLNHTSGLGNYLNFITEREMHYKPLPRDTILNIIRRQAILCKPGTAYNYSSSGYYLLGCIIENLSGNSLSKYINDNILEIAGMKNSGFYKSDSVIINRADGYIRSKGALKRASYAAFENNFSAGGMFSTAMDLYKWCKALTGMRIINQQSYDKMIFPYIRDSRQPQYHYGYGLEISNLKNHQCVSHGGYMFGARADVSMYPKDGLYIIILSNEQLLPIINIESLRDALAATYFDIQVTKPYKPIPITLDKEVLKKYICSFDYLEDKNEIILTDNKLFWKSKYGRPVELLSESETLFYMKDNYYHKLDFKFDKRGQLVGIDYILGGLRYGTTLRSQNKKEM